MKQFSKIVGTFLFAAFANTAIAGMIVVNHDEWTLSNTGFSQSPDASVFTDNIAQFFSGGGAGNFHAYSNNFGLIESSLGTAFSNAGHTYSTGAGISFDLATLQTYDGIFLAGDAVGLDTSILVNYVNAGGSVYLAGGTGFFGGAAGEAAFWNTFLNPFGLGYTSPYNGVGGNLSVQPSPHQIFNNVSTLYQNNGNTVVDIINPNPNAAIYFNGLYAVYDDTSSSVPEPSILALFGAGLFGISFARRRMRS